MGLGAIGDGGWGCGGESGEERCLGVVINSLSPLSHSTINSSLPMSPRHGAEWVGRVGDGNEKSGSGGEDGGNKMSDCYSFVPLLVWFERDFHCADVW